MKRVLSFIVLSLIVALSSCMTLEEIVKKNYPVNVDANALFSKVAVNGTSLIWEDNDILQLVAVAQSGDKGDARLNVYSKNGSSASFTGFVTMNDVPQSCVFTYPANLAMQVADDCQTVTVDYSLQDGSHKPFLYSVTNYNDVGINASLHHVGAVLELDIEIPGVQSVTFKGNNNEHLYPLILDLSTGGITHSNIDGPSITVPVNSSGKTYINVPPVNLTRGFTLILETQDGSRMYKSFSSDGTANGGYDFTDAVGKIIPINMSGDFQKFGVSLKQCSVNHTKSGNLLTGTTVSVEMQKTGISDKLIEEWGARLTMGGTVVRSIVCTDKLLSDGAVVLTAADGYPLLPAGDYQLTPFYRAFGQDVSLNSVNVNVTDPGVTITTAGTTSYDVYKSKGATDANDHTNTLIKGVSASINVHPDILDSFKMTFPAEASDNKYELSGTTSNVLNPGDLTRKTFTTHTMTVTAKVGVINVSATKNFIITGLPYVTTFKKTSYLPDWQHTNVQMDDGMHVLPDKTASYVISPRFYAPVSFEVKATIKAYLYIGWVYSGQKKANLSIGVTSNDSYSKSPQNTELSGQDDYDVTASYSNISYESTFSGQNTRISLYAYPSIGKTVAGKTVGIYLNDFTLNYK
jgi:hypothetical protein